jgi:C1A family cysteine protease
LDEHDPYPPGSGLGGGHAAAVVGYTAAGNFIIRNSWGTGWGRDGFAFGSPLYMDQAVTEAYGIDI